MTSKLTVFLLINLRFWEFCSSVLVMSLLAAAMSESHFHGSKRFNFSLAQGAIGTCYSLFVILLPPIVPGLVFAGFYFCWEVIMNLLWLCCFIVVAKVVGEHSCHNKFTKTYNPKYGSQTRYQETGGEYNPFTNKYTTKRYHVPCNCAKAAIAFAGLSWLLSCFSCIVLWYKVCRPIKASHGRSGLWKTGNSMGVRLHRFTTMTLADDADNQLMMQEAEPPVEDYAPPTKKSKKSKKAVQPEPQPRDSGVSETDIESGDEMKEDKLHQPETNSSGSTDGDAVV
ncbi:hypothetical protein TBLA_0B00670 [Henningerozyma blattae CBS 6284]|uniref:MARVEL domain-containing protein n=1 Tax=Henningerozyma blattae (strain ATCC 34711 / CBS 6284 / DSM 70876 / NBRC 10599 / NRRL Y-10934 / UCD 77-7) TaxID=1071380 RepID=I2GXQ8_HENB6|nr:hypothetical protein TBLA_0B00670 [Tetrapisispora blattae CBS 6284]CCH58910.1 hypothetical protein TBLA_0B00670 [Tetrapisispora blattae CBS 6284]